MTHLDVNSLRFSCQSGMRQVIKQLTEMEQSRINVAPLKCMAP